MNSKHPSIDQENPLVGINTREEEEKGRQLSPGQKVHIELPLRFKISAGFFNERRRGGAVRSNRSGNGPSRGNTVHKGGGIRNTWHILGTPSHLMQLQCRCDGAMAR